MLIRWQQKEAHWWKMIVEMWYDGGRCRRGGGRELNGGGCEEEIEDRIVGLFVFDLRTKRFY